MGKIERKVAVDAELLADAEAQGVGIDEALAEGLKAALARKAAASTVSAEEKARRWAEENAEAIRTHNERIAARGIFGEDMRRW